MPDLPTREEIVGKIAHGVTGLYAATCCFRTGGRDPSAQNCECRIAAAEILDSLTLLDLAAEMKRKDAEVVDLDGGLVQVTFERGG